MKTNKFVLAVVFFMAVFINSIFAADHKSADNNGGWVDVPLSDIEPFDINCEYQMFRFRNDSGRGPRIEAIDCIMRQKDRLSFKTSRLNELVLMLDQDKGHPHYCNDGCCSPGPVEFDTVVNLQKRCSIPDTTPSGLVATFDLKECPDGWSKWPFGKASVECNALDCHLVICKKN